MIIREKELHPSPGLIFLLLLPGVGGVSIAWFIRSARAEQALPGLVAIVLLVAAGRPWSATSWSCCAVIGPPLRSSTPALCTSRPR